MVTETKFQTITGPHGEAKQLAARRLRSEMTPAESRLWYCLRANRLDGLHFRRQQVIDGFIAACAVIQPVSPLSPSESSRFGRTL